VSKSLRARHELRQRIRRLAFAEAELDASLRAAQQLCLAGRRAGCPPQAIDHADHWRDELAQACREAWRCVTAWEFRALQSEVPHRSATVPDGFHRRQQEPQS